MTEEQKEKYANFLGKVSEILGLNKPVDILRLYAVTDEYFQPIEKRIAELEKENEIFKKANKIIAQQRDDRDESIAELEETNEELTCQMRRNFYCYSCTNATDKCYRKEIGCPCGKYKSYKDENAELKSIAEFQQSSNMNTHFENKRLKEGLAVGSTFNKALNSMNKALEEERDKYRKYCI